MSLKSLIPSLDDVERIFWTGVATGLAVMGEMLVNLDLAWTPIAALAVNQVLLWLRRTMPWLPNPGDGLPGVPQRPHPTPQEPR